MNKPQPVVDYACDTGENPLWHPQEKRIYWVDIPVGCIFRYDPESGDSEKFEIGEAIGGFTIQADGALLLFMARGAVRLWRDGRVLAAVIEELPDERLSRFNDVIADPEGRVFCGTMTSPDHSGRLYRLDTDGRITQLLDGIGTSNGLGFTPDLKHMYYTDTRKREIYLFDYDRSTGNISNRRVFVKVSDDPKEGGPDGLTVDVEGCVWSARWGGSCIVRYAPDGKELTRIQFPVRKVSCMTFGGRDYKDMYVTTAGGGNRKEEGALAGALFRVNADVRGVPEFLSRVRV